SPESASAPTSPLSAPCCRSARLITPFPTRRSSDLASVCRRPRQPDRLGGGLCAGVRSAVRRGQAVATGDARRPDAARGRRRRARSEEHTSELQSLRHLVCRLLLEKKKQRITRLY